MDFGIFLEFQPRPGQGEGETLAEGLDLVDAAEAWGLDAAWLAEFHFSPQRSVLASPIVVAGAIAGRTRRIRIGMAVYVLPLNHPLRIAEEVATLDQVSGGRLELGVGRSGFTGFYRGYAVPYAQSRGRFEETLAVLQKAWTGEPFSHRGEFFAFEDVTVCPRPRQRPHPPLRMAATTGETFARVGRRGLPIFVGLRGDGTAELRRNLEAYRAAWRGAGHPGGGSVYLRVPVFAAGSERAARDGARESLTYYFERQSRLLATDAERHGGGDRAAMAARLAQLDYDTILRTRVAVGSPAGLTEHLGALQAELGLDGIVAEPNAGGLLAPEQVRESVRLIAEEVLPRFK